VSGLNKQQIIGNLGNEPELRHTKSGAPVLEFRAAVTEKWKDQGGELKEHTEWFTVVMFGPRAEPLSRILTKGQLVYVEGSQQTRTWDDNDGKTRYFTQLKAQNVELLGSSRDRGSAPGPGDVPPSGGDRKSSGFGEDDIPF